MFKNISILVLAIFICVDAQADAAIISQGTLVVLEGTTTPPLPLASFDKIAKVKNSLRLLVKKEGAATSSDAGIPKTDTTGTVYLNSVSPGPFNTTTEVELTQSGKTIVKIRIFSTNPDLFNYIGQNPTIYNNALIAKGEKWYLIDDTKIVTDGVVAKPMNGATTSMVASAAGSSDSGIDQIIADPENGGGSFYPRAGCFRFYNPVPNTVNHYGIQVWQINNPIPAGFSLKNESPDFSMRCPHSNYQQQENLVDGLYRRSWGTTAFKIPNHCTSVRKPGNSFCCCTAALSVVYGTCRYIYTPSYYSGGWPTAGLMCR
jgi:hypothetical protein